MAEMITRCPQCNTAFRITPAHLKSARGSVRCGSCLFVFDARKHLVVASTQAPEPNPPAAEQPADDAAQDRVQTPVTPEPIGETDDILISDDMDVDSDELSDEFRSAFADDDSTDFSSFSPTQTSLFEREASQEPGDEVEPEDDESWALKLLDEDDLEPAATGEDVESAETEEDSEPFQSTPAQPTPAQPTPAEADAAGASMDDENWLEQGEALAATAGAVSVTESIDDTRQDAEETQPSGAAREDIFSEIDEDAEAFAAPPLRADREGRSYLDAIEPEPVEFSVRRERRFWRSRLLWGLLSLLALLLLTAQIAWLQYPSLSRTEPYRSFYAWACGWLNCELPQLRDADAIRTSNLVVRSHPRLDNALMVDVILQNTAPFAQPFPVLEITFSDLQSQIVAQRRFGPDKYLGGELAGKSMMPVRQPIHIALEIVDPGPEAVNYRISVMNSR